jgi:hypothetical protein
MAEFKVCVELILDHASGNYNRIRNISKSLESINERLDVLVTDIEKGNRSIDEKHIKALKTFIFTAAQQIETYAGVVMELSRFDHNMTMICRTLYHQVV